MRGHLPDYVCDAMEVLAEAGGKPYVVGGAVRDIKMGRVPHDYDIASDLLPDDVIGILQENKHNRVSVVDNLGNNFGVVVGVFDGNPVEIATFRSDAYGLTDAHRPESVSFGVTLEEDLSRRDFTCNAMALGMDGNFVDPFHGANDIERGYLCPVAREGHYLEDAEKRYREDPLRLYRACRFVSQLGFTYSENRITPASVFCSVKGFWRECKAQDLSMERVRKEMEKLLLGKYPKEGLMLLMESGLVDAPCLSRRDGTKTYVSPLQSLAHLYGLPQNPKHHRFDAWGHTVEAVTNIGRTLPLRYAALFHDVGKGLEGVRGEKNGQPTDHGHEKMSASIVFGSLCDGFGYNKRFARDVQWIVRNHMDFMNLIDADSKQVKRWVRNKAKGFRKQKDLVEGIACLREMFRADMSASRNDTEQIGKMLLNLDVAHSFAERSMPLHSSDLRIDGRKVKEAADANGLDIAAVYGVLLKQVQDEVVPNDEKSIAVSLRRYVSRQGKEGR